MGEAIMLKCLGRGDPKSAGRLIAQLSDLLPSNRKHTPEREEPEWERWIHLSNVKLRIEASGQHVALKLCRFSGHVIKLSTLCGAAICFYLSFTLIIVTLKSAVRSGKKQPVVIVTVKQEQSVTEWGRLCLDAVAWVVLPLQIPYHFPQGWNSPAFCATLKAYALINVFLAQADDILKVLQ